MGDSPAGSVAGAAGAGPVAAGGSAGGAAARDHAQRLADQPPVVDAREASPARRGRRRP